MARRIHRPARGTLAAGVHRALCARRVQEGVAAHSMNPVPPDERARFPARRHAAYSDSMSIRIETYDGGEVLYFAFDPDGVWARSSSAARTGAEGAFKALLSGRALHENGAAVKRALASLQA